LRDWTVTDALLSRFADSGRPYRVEAVFLATPSAESQLGILMRFQLGLERAGIGRYVTKDLHDARYDHTPRAAAWREADPRVAAITVYRRGDTHPVFRNERDREGRWAQPDHAADVITAQRDQPLSIADSRAFLRLHASLDARMHPFFHGPLAAASAATEPLPHPDAATPRRNRPAVTFGRYQIVSIAHLDTIRTILMDWPTVVGSCPRSSERPGPRWLRARSGPLPSSSERDDATDVLPGPHRAEALVDVVQRVAGGDSSSSSCPSRQSCSSRGMSKAGLSEPNSVPLSSLFHIARGARIRVVDRQTCPFTVTADDAANSAVPVSSGG
jgi:hypothetical protein